MSSPTTSEYEAGEPVICELDPNGLPHNWDAAGTVKHTGCAYFYGTDFSAVRLYPGTDWWVIQDHEPRAKLAGPFPTMTVALGVMRMMKAAG